MTTLTTRVNDLEKEIKDLKAMILNHNHNITKKITKEKTLHPNQIKIRDDKYNIKTSYPNRVKSE